MMNKLPKARTAQILEQEAGKELLIYDLRTNKTFVLNETLTTVFKACDGKTSFEDLKLQADFNDDLIHFALSELKAGDLLENYGHDHFTGLSRREVIKKVGYASMMVLPMIYSLVAPSAARAQSVLGCAANADCPPSNTPCQDFVCAGGTCQLVPAPAGSPAGNGLICDGGGNAVQCVTAADCPGQDNVCQTRTCTTNVCGFSFAPLGTPVPGGTCDGSGGITPTPPSP